MVFDHPAAYEHLKDANYADFHAQFTAFPAVSPVVHASTVLGHHGKCYPVRLRGVYLLRERDVPHPEYLLLDPVGFCVELQHPGIQLWMYAGYFSAKGIQQDRLEQLTKGALVARNKLRWEDNL